MRRLVLALLVACGGGGQSPPDSAFSLDVGSPPTATVSCGLEGALCLAPDVCCDSPDAADRCLAPLLCRARTLACDGPEDCPGEECCRFDDRSQCLQTGICGATGVLSEVMCHDDDDCDRAAREVCCPSGIIYGTCVPGGCPI